MNKKVQLTEKQIGELESLFEKVTAYGRTIKDLSVEAKRTEDKAWEVVHSICPEAKDKGCFYNHDDHTIEIYEPTETPSPLTGG